MPEVRIRPVRGLPEIDRGDDLAGIIAGAAGDLLTPGAIVCIAHKLVSKAEGAVARLADVTASPRAAQIAAGSGRDPRHVQVILDETAELMREERGVLICRTHHGFVCANAGVDQSNAGDADLVLLPRDPDASARNLRAGLARFSGVAPLGVLISDSFGRAWRHGQVDVAIGLAGVAATVDHTGLEDRAGRTLQATLPALADEVSAAAGLARTKAGDEGVVVITGLERFVSAADGPGAAALLRSRAEDLFP